MSKPLLQGVPHFDKAYSSPKLGVANTKHIVGFGEHSNFFTPKSPPKVKSGVTGLGLGKRKISSQSSNLGRAFPPKLKGLP